MTMPMRYMVRPVAMYGDLNSSDTVDAFGLTEVKVHSAREQLRLLRTVLTSAIITALPAGISSLLIASNQ